MEFLMIHLFLKHLNESKNKNLKNCRAYFLHFAYIKTLIKYRLVEITQEYSMLLRQGQS